MDIGKLITALNEWFDDGGDPDTLRDTTEQVIREREDDWKDKD